MLAVPPWPPWGAFRDSGVLTASAALLQDLFLQFDADKSGTMSSYELRTALRAAGEATPLLRVRESVLFCLSVYFVL